MYTPCADQSALVYKLLTSQLLIGGEVPCECMMYRGMSLLVVMAGEARAQLLSVNGYGRNGGCSAQVRPCLAHMYLRVACIENAGAPR